MMTAKTKNNNTASKKSNQKTKAATKKSEKKPRKISVFQVVVVLILAIVLFLVVDLGRQAAANYQVQREAELLSQQLMLAKEHQNELLSRRSYVASDLFVEQVARKELKWAKNGETVLVILPHAEESKLFMKTETATMQTVNTSQTPPQAWWTVFFGDTEQTVLKNEERRMKNEE
ncbi:hypothetical protein QUF58_00565 [Anaerolineales bacterium HSG24]|nr:hypothetical protein [Anaerolineales bacterium HSG24]